MANEEHLALLKQGVEAWNRWRQEHPEAQPDLSGAILHLEDLNGVDLHMADLTVADLSGANLSDADLSKANMSYASLDGADLSRANLKATLLHDAYLHKANLTGANLNEADLLKTNLAEANLTAAHLHKAYMRGAYLDNLDLSRAEGLETVRHHGPSTLGIDTIYLSQGQIPESFLRGAGVPENFIEYMRSLVVKPIDYYSCFISHSSKDKDFCQRLYNDLQAAGVRRWLDSEDLKIGDRFWERIDESIRLHDKLLIVLSEHSVESAWVRREVMAALEKEDQSPGTTVLFPVRLDDTVMTIRQPWAADLRRERHIGDFTHWKDHDAYQQAFARLLRDLQAEGSRAGN